MIIDFFESMDSALRTYWYIAIASSAFFVLQTILSFTGGDSDSVDMDIDAETDSSMGEAHSFSIFDLFSLRNIGAFLMGIGWTGVVLYSSIASKILLLVLSILVGCIFVALFFVTLKSMLKLAENNSFDINNCVNKLADVYLTIPSNKSGKGKVLISINGSVHELAAVTNEPEAIKNGKNVKVTGVYDNSVLIVESIIDKVKNINNVQQ